MKGYDIIIQGGQSNAEGSGLGEVEKEYIPDDDILYLEAEKSVEAPIEGVRVTYADKPFFVHRAEERLGKDNRILGDFALTFSEKYKQSGLLKVERKILIVRAAVGGTGFQKGHWGLGDPLYKKMLEMTDYALSLDGENRVVAFLWHQGEHDAFEGNNPENYKKQLLDMTKNMRERYGNIPYIAGDFSNEWKSKNRGICDPIINTIRAVTEEIGNAGFVETADLPSNNQKTGNGDDIHFCRNSLHKLGERYFKTYQGLIEGNKV